MQTVVLPPNVCERLYVARDFLWGSKQGERKLHLISWEVVCQPKKCGGLRIRPAIARWTNLAMMSKLAWRLFKEKDHLWARILIRKYRLEDNIWPANIVVRT